MLRGHQQNFLSAPIREANPLLGLACLPYSSHELVTAKKKILQDQKNGIEHLNFQSF
jgi:hypothetical protein